MINKNKKMKTKPALFSIIFFVMINFGFAQKKSSLSIIQGRVGLPKYHNSEELKLLPKGELLGLYKQRIEIIIKILPNIAFTTKPGATLETLGIPEDKNNVKALENSHEAFANFFDSTIEFQSKILPYSDKGDLVAAILFYESTLKLLNTYDDFKNQD